MAFYLKPPSEEEASIITIEKCSLQRLKCYENLYSDNIKDIITQELKCLAEDSHMDRTGHFMLRLVALQTDRFLNTFIKNEVKLLDVRLSSYTQDNVKKFLRKLKRHAIELLEKYNQPDGDGIEEDKLKETYLLCVRVSLELLNKKAFEHAFKLHENDEVCAECEEFCLKIPFQFCLDLVASRECKITKGYVEVYSFQWKKLILALFKDFLRLDLKLTRKFILNKAMRDFRIKDIILELKERVSRGFSEFGNVEDGKFKIAYIDSEFKNFPPCMRNLYDILMKNNRLSHNARYHFSLFLKSIGVSLDDQVIFWQNIYSKEHGSCSKCSHDWESNKKRYIYSIRHLYGLEGCRREGFVKSCQDIEDILLTSNEEGGCPFKHFDDENLRKMLQIYLPSQDTEVIIHERKKLPKKACKLFFKEFMNKNFEKNVEDEPVVVHQDPAQYYLMVKNLTTVPPEDFFEDEDEDDENDD